MGGRGQARRAARQAASTLEALAYTDLLNGLSALERIAFASSADTEGSAGAGQDDAGDGGGGPGDGGVPGDDGGSEGGPGPSRDPRPDDSRGPAAQPPRGFGPDAGGPGADAGRPGGRPAVSGEPADPPVAPPPLAEVTVPLATLQQRAERAGDNRLLGPFDPALARDLAVAAARSPRSCWEIIVVDEHEYATGSGIARLPRGTSGPAAGGRPAAPGRPRPVPGPSLAARRGHGC